MKNAMRFYVWTLPISKYSLTQKPKKIYKWKFISDDDERDISN